MEEIAQRRDLSIDILKTIVVIPMVLCHFIQLLLFQFGIINPLLVYIASYINLVSFSCFYFAFGYSVSIAYLPKEKSAIITKLKKNFERLTLGFCCSSVCFVLCFFTAPTIQNIAKVLSLRLVAGYSEFLLAFIFTIPIIYFFKDFLNKVSDWRILLISSIICLACTFIPYHQINENIIGIFIGTTKYACFPIVQYFPCFLLGIYLQNHKEILSKIRLDITILCYLLFIVCYFFLLKDQTKRFPPSFLWIICACLPLLFYAKVSAVWAQTTKFEKTFIWIGKHIFSIVIISNIIFFVAYKIIKVFVA